MYDLLIALAYIGILVLPIIVAIKNSPDVENEQPDPDRFRGHETWH